jgi:hypothetical protein
MPDECANSPNPTRCMMKHTAIKAVFLIVVGVAFTAALGGGLIMVAGH